MKPEVFLQFFRKSTGSVLTFSAFGDHRDTEIIDLLTEDLGISWELIPHYLTATQVREGIRHEQKEQGGEKD